MYDFVDRRVELRADHPATPEQFLREHVRAHRPCLVRGGAADWPAMSLWRDDRYLREQAGHVTIERFVAARDGFRFNYTSAKQEMTLSAFIESYRARPDVYMIDVDLPGELESDLGDHDILRGFRQLENYHQRTAFYLGAGGQLTELHYEYEDLVHVVVDGEKDFFLFDTTDFPRLYPEEDDPAGPDFSRLDVARPELCPDAANALLYQVRLRAGDVLYVPCYWWHGVRSHGRNMDLSYKRADRRSQVRAFCKLLECGVFADDGGHSLTSWRDRDQVAPQLIDELRVGSTRVPDDDLVSHYLNIGIAYEYLCEHRRDASWLLDSLERDKARIVNALAAASLSRSGAYLLETFYRVQTGLFQV